MNKKVLFVDDDSNILQGYKRILRKDFDISIALGGEEAIEIITHEGNFAVIVSDMRMPEMDGVELLALVKEIAPESVRVMLTGDAGQQTAINAVNEGMIFRFLTKPCSIESIVRTLNMAIEQHHLLIAERELLEETLSQSLEVLVNILSLVNPAAFSRALRVKHLAGEVATRLGIKNLWELRAAAMLSQVGCVTVPEKTLQKVVQGIPLSSKESDIYNNYPHIGYELIARIPRMKSVAEIIAHQNFRLVDYKSEDTRFLGAVTVKCAQILKAVLDFDKLLYLGNSPHEAYGEMNAQKDWYDPLVTLTIKNLIEENVVEYQKENLDISHLQPGMILDADIYSADGTLVLKAGQEINSVSLIYLKNFAAKGCISQKIVVQSPKKRSFEESYSLLARNSAQSSQKSL